MGWSSRTDFTAIIGIFEVWLIFQVSIVMVVSYYAEVPNEPNQGYALGAISLMAALVATAVLGEVIDYCRKLPRVLRGVVRGGFQGGRLSGRNGKPAPLPIEERRDWQRTVAPPEFRDE